MKILLVDDTKKHRKAGFEQLTALGHEVVALSSYADAAKVARNEKFDVALIDLLMPAEGMTLGGKGLEHLGQPIDVGYSLSIKLALEGIKLIGVVTDMNHHHHPATAIMDWFLGKNLEICGSRVRYMQAYLLEGDIKDWDFALETLLRKEE